MTQTRAAAPTAQTPARVTALLRDTGYVLWLSQRVAAEIKAEACQAVAGPYAEACETAPAACAA